MRDTKDTATAHNSPTTCWLCGETLTEDTVVRLRIDGGVEALHPDCGEQVSKSTDGAGQ